MNYKIRVSGNLEFQRLVGTIVSKDVRGVGHGLFSQVDAISLIYDGGKLKFLQDYDDTIARAVDDDKIGTIYEILL